MPRHGEEGFTLIEVIVALMVAALLFGIVMQGALSAKERQNKASARIEAVELAALLIAERQNGPLQEGDSEGAQNKLSWLVREEVVAEDPRGFFALVRIEVRLTNADGREVYSVSTRKLKRLGA